MLSAEGPWPLQGSAPSMRPRPLLLLLSGLHSWPVPPNFSPSRRPKKANPAGVGIGSSALRRRRPARARHQIHVRTPPKDQLPLHALSHSSDCATRHASPAVYRTHAANSNETHAHLAPTAGCRSTNPRALGGCNLGHFQLQPGPLPAAGKQLLTVKIVGSILASPRHTSILEHTQARHLASRSEQAGGGGCSRQALA